MARFTLDWRALRRAIAGELLGPDSPGYELARKPAIVNFQDVRPQAVARCESAADVAAYHGANLDRLLRVRATYDPGGFLGPAD